MESLEGDRVALAWELVRQNYAFVVGFAAIIWDFSITIRQEVKYIWSCPSSATKYLFLLCRYYALGYIITCSIFGTQWTLPISASSKNCRTWFLIHVSSIGLMYFSSQLTLIRKVFYLYGKSTLLATGLFAVHCSQIAGSFVLSHHISGSLNFNPICNGRNAPKSILSIFCRRATITCNQSIIWALILRKICMGRPKFLPSRRRYLPTSDAYARIASGLCLVAILFGSSRSVVHQHLSTVYVFTLPVIMLSIGTCRYMLQVERDRNRRSKLAEDIRNKDQSQDKAGPTPKQDPHSYPPQPIEEAPSPLADPEDLENPSTRTSETQAGSRDLDTISSFPYLHGAQSYKLNRSRKSLATTATNESPRNSSDCTRQRTPSLRMSLSRSSRLSATAVSHMGSAVSIDLDDSNGDWEETQSASDIEIGSLHSTMTVNSEELREFYNDAWNVGPFMVAGP